MSTVHTATFNGVRYTIDTDPIDGCCSPPKPGDRDPILRVCRPLNTMKGIETACHEALHACNFDKKEETVARTARDVGRFLWRLGYRRPSPGQEGSTE
jgi:hypothetical protein